MLFFVEFLKLAEGGAFLYAKNNSLFVTFLYEKKIHLALRLYTKIKTLCVTFYMQKTIVSLFLGAQEGGVIGGG